MEVVIPGITRPGDLALSATSSASAAVTDMVEASRNASIADLAVDLRQREVAENLADALQSVCLIELEYEALSSERRTALGDLLSAASRFVEGWV